MKEKIYQRNPDIVFRKIADETILVPIRGNVADMQKLFMLNPVAEFVWQHLAGKSTLASICMDVADNFEVDWDAAETDVLEFVKQLHSFDLINEVMLEKKPI